MIAQQFEVLVCGRDQMTPDDIVQALHDYIRTQLPKGRMIAVDFGVSEQELEPEHRAHIEGWCKKEHSPEYLDRILEAAMQKAGA